MLAREILADQGGRLWLGPRGEQLYARRNFHELYAVFSTPRLITVFHDSLELGNIDARFLQGLGDDKGPASFTLGGRPWQVVSIKWPRGTCHVRPAEDAGRTRWSGTPQFQDHALSQAIRDLLTSDTIAPTWSTRAQKVIAEQRQEHMFLRETPQPFVRDPGGLTWWTHAGGRANLLLARMLEAELGGSVVARDSSLTLKAEAGASEYAVRQYLAHLAEQARPNLADARHHTNPGASRLSKFEPCLPDDLLADLEAYQTLDWETAANIVGPIGAHPHTG